MAAMKTFLGLTALGGMAAGLLDRAFHLSGEFKLPMAVATFLIAARCVLRDRRDGTGGAC
jgi:hypothetical protein